MDGFRDRLSDRAARANAAMSPVYFAMVMATGIVSTALFFLGYKELSTLLFCVNLIAYPVLIGATAYRIARFGSRLWADLINPQTVFAFFTFVAASSVLGVQFFLRGGLIPAVALWGIAAAAWLLLVYFSFGMLTFTSGRSLGDIVNASWLILIVGTQSLTVLGALLARQMGGSEPLLLFGFGLWSIGIALYGIFITLIIQRLFFQKLDPHDMFPPYWIILGATAIGALAGVNLLAAASPQAAFLQAVTPLIKGMTLALWAWSSWWIPTLLIFGVWRHAVCRVPVTYHPGYWSLVFPLGMYTVATYRISVVLNLPFLQIISAVMVWVALAAWIATMAGFLRMCASAVAASWNSRKPAPLCTEAR